MYNVINNGDRDKLGLAGFTKGFECENCGCIFRTDMYIRFENTARNEFESRTVCPWCGGEVESDG